MEYRYTAIVLEKQEVGETDRLYTLYTKEAGKQRVLAKGVRKSEAKLASGLETMNLATINVVRGRGMGKVVGVLPEETFLRVRSDFSSYQTALEILARVARLTETDEPDEAVFALLREWLALLNTTENQEQILFLRCAFLCKLYALLGYTIHTTTCQQTGEKLTRAKRYFFEPWQGGFIAGDVAMRSAQAFGVSSESIVLIRAILGNNLKSLLKIQDATRYTSELKRIEEQFFVWSVR